MLHSSFVTKTVMLVFAITFELSIQDIFDKTTTLGALEHFLSCSHPILTVNWIIKAIQRVSDLFIHSIFDIKTNI